MFSTNLLSFFFIYAKYFFRHIYIIGLGMHTFKLSIHLFHTKISPFFFFIIFKNIQDYLKNAKWILTISITWSFSLDIHSMSRSSAGIVSSSLFASFIKGRNCFTLDKTVIKFRLKVKKKHMFFHIKSSNDMYVWSSNCKTLYLHIYTFVLVNNNLRCYKYKYIISWKPRSLMLKNVISCHVQ